MAKQDKTTKSTTGKVTGTGKSEKPAVDPKSKSRFSDDDEDDDFDLPIDDLEGFDDLSDDDEDDF